MAPNEAALQGLKGGGQARKGIRGLASASLQDTARLSSTVKVLFAFFDRGERRLALSATLTLPQRKQVKASDMVSAGNRLTCPLWVSRLEGRWQEERRQAKSPSWAVDVRQAVRYCALVVVTTIAKVHSSPTWLQTLRYLFPPIKEHECVDLDKYRDLNSPAIAEGHQGDGRNRYRGSGRRRRCASDLSNHRKELSQHLTATKPTQRHRPYPGSNHYYVPERGDAAALGS